MAVRHSETEPALIAHPLEIGRKRIRLQGIVQGVGFRPFVYRLAQEIGLSGSVQNTADGVLIEVEGEISLLARFLELLPAQAPPLAQIDAVTVETLEPAGATAFVIGESLDTADQYAPVSPDVATCNDCYREFTDPGDRRYGYPFTNCTNCGPRYTIIRGIPYDRQKTTMADFQMCPACQREFDAPASRRFHAQPNACPACGPNLALVRSHPGMKWEAPAFAPGGQSLGLLREVRQLLRWGQIVALRGLGGFHLACDASNDTAVKRLRDRKRRSHKPFAIMVPDLASAERLCVVGEAERRALTGLRRPIVILIRRRGAGISADVAPQNNTLGLMQPYTPLHYLLFADSPEQTPAFPALVMTSGNISEEPIVTSNEEAWTRLGTVADWFLLHNRDIHTRVDDSVVRVSQGTERVLRRSRGYAPYPIDLGIPLGEILAFGGELKNTFCLTRDHYAFLSQHIGDMENYETLLFFKETLERLKKLLRITPRAVAYDLHPLYLSSQYAISLEGIEKIGVQHHHAHIASCMAENGLREKVIGVALDGTGYGTDGQIWGGEFFIADFSGFERRAHFRYVPLAGGDSAVREPWRSALSYLCDTFGTAELEICPFAKQISPKHLAIVETMIQRGLHTVLTSSCGRLFDAVASLLGIRHVITYEGQAAIELEMAARHGVVESYPFDLTGSDVWELDFRPMIERIIGEIRASEQPRTIAAKFHNTLGTAIRETCRRLRRETGLRRVCLSGGTFQNQYLLERTVYGLRGDGFEVYLHARVPPNDGGISLGQAMVANEILRRRV